MMYRTVEPRTVMVSRVTAFQFSGVYLTARKAMFMRGDTEVMVSAEADEHSCDQR